MFNKNKIYTIKEIAEILRTSPATIRKKIKQGKLKKTSVKRKGKILLLGTEINKYLKKVQ